MKKIILFNGPPLVGKDTAGDIITSHDLLGKDVAVEKFARPLVEALASYSGLHINSVEFVILREMHKDKPVLANGTLTPRQFMQDLSTLMKKYWGDGVFGEMCARVCNKLSNEYILITDAGFQAEVERFRDLVEGEVDVVQINRPAYTFADDTREYVKFEDRGYFVLNNDGTLTDYRLAVTDLVKFAKWNER